MKAIAVFDTFVILSYNNNNAIYRKRYEIMNYLIGIDIGTYSSKGILVDTRGKIYAKAERQHDLSIPKHGWAEHNAETLWWKDFCDISKELIANAAVPKKDIKAVGASAIAPCVLPVDKNGHPLREAILYGIDTRSTHEIEILESALGKAWILENSGADLSSQSAGPKILWIHNNEPEVWLKSQKFLTSTSYLVFKLTGRYVIDHYTAAFFGPLYDLKNKQWSLHAARYICEISQLPEILWTTEVAGTVTDQAARETGLASGTPVIVGTADAASEAISAGLSSTGDTMLMYGSSMFIISLTNHLASGGVFWPAPFIYHGTYALAAGMATAGSITEWFKRNFATPTKTEQTAFSVAPNFETLAFQASAVPPGSEGLIALPYFSGERTPLNDPKARGVIAGLTLRHKSEHIYRALLEGVAYGIRHNLEALRSSGADIQTLFAVGGGTKNSLWMHIVSDVIGEPQIVRDTIGASYGDAFLAGIGTGLIKDRFSIKEWLNQSLIIEPNSSNHLLYNKYFTLYKRLYEKNADILHELTNLGMNT